MLSSALVALALSVSGALAAPGLSLTLTGASHFAGVDSAVVSATVTNTGDETLKLLNAPDTVLSKLPTYTFAMNRAGDHKLPRFIGAVAKYVPEKAKSFTVLAPGESVTVEHSLGAAYDFSVSGAGAYSIEPVSSAFSISTPEGIQQIYADTIAHEAILSGDLTIARKTVAKRTPTYDGCSSSQKTAIKAAAKGAQAYVLESYNYLSNHTSSTTRYKTWFGTYTSARHTKVKTQYSKLNAKDYSSFEYDCSTCTEADTYAYTYPDEPDIVFLCDVFWEAPATGTDSKAGTLVHESTHWTATAGTEDYAYGQTAAKSLAKSNPAHAVENADSHEYFSENNPSQS